MNKKKPLRKKLERGVRATEAWGLKLMKGPHKGTISFEASLFRDDLPKFDNWKLVRVRITEVKR